MDTDAAAAKLPGGGDAPGTGPAGTQPMGSAGEGGSGLGTSGIAGLGPLKDLEQGVKPSDIRKFCVLILPFALVQTDNFDSRCTLPNPTKKTNK